MIEIAWTAVVIDAIVCIILAGWLVTSIVANFLDRYHGRYRW